MRHLLLQEGLQEAADPAQANVLIVNTCGFIADARDESIQELGKLSKLKTKSQILIAAGCLAQRYGETLVQSVPGLDGVLGTRSWMDIASLVRHQQRGRGHVSCQITRGQTYPEFPRYVPQYAVQGGSAYLKIADGCRHACSFCAIPLIKGSTRSRPMSVILEDAVRLQALGVKELVLIAQDSTDYGTDLGLKDGLPQLLDGLVKVCPEIHWIRIMYAYPGLISKKLIDRISRLDQIVPYIDLPLQHANRKILRSMKRPFETERVYRTIADLRAAIPHIAIRSTFIVGYPGESEEQFSELLDFIRTVKFDRVGAFAYSFEKGTPGEKLGDPVPWEVKQDRLGRLLEVQQPISLALNQQWVGRTLDMLVEGNQSGLVVGRSYRDAPEIDGLVLARGDHPVGQMCQVQITGAMEYDLTGFVKK